VIGTYHKCVAETVARFDGFVAKYMGDGVLSGPGWRSLKPSTSCASSSRSRCASASPPALGRPCQA
jgi:class 3 adenylate cyclase